MNMIDLNEAWAMLDIAKRAEIAVSAKPQNTLDAEISEGAHSDWYLVQTLAGEEASAARWLARRKFGVFRPMQQRHGGPYKERIVQGWEPVFPGWLFVFLWNASKMSARLINCPGVFDVLRDPTTNRPVSVDAPDMSEDGLACLWPRVGFIDRLRALSWVYDETAPALASVRSHAAARGMRRTPVRHRKLDPKTRRELQMLKEHVKRRHIWDEEAWERANQLDAGQRITLLRRALTGMPLK